MHFTWNLTTLKLTVSFITRSESVTGSFASSCPTNTSLRSRELKIFTSSVTGLTVGIYKKKQGKAVVQSCNEIFIKKIGNKFKLYLKGNKDLKYDHLVARFH